MVSESVPAGIDLRINDGHYAILDQGAHALAWQPPGSRPVLWASSQARFAPGVAVRGGVPVVFPWFGSGLDGTRKPAHGSARITEWKRVSARCSDDELTVGYQMPNVDELSVALRAVFTAEEFSVTLTVANTGAAPVTYEVALHTYLAVGDIRLASVHGLEGAAYIDTVGGTEPGPHVQAGPLRFTAETDRRYTHHGTAVLHDPAWGRSIVVEKSGSASTVIWNPWIDKAALMSDFGDDEWLQMVCIEAGNLREQAVTLHPGQSAEIAQSLSVEALVFA